MSANNAYFRRKLFSPGPPRPPKVPASLGRGTVLATAELFCGSMMVGGNGELVFAARDRQKDPAA
jgi:hypothetical protein